MRGNLLFAFATLGLIACRGGGTHGDDDANNGGDTNGVIHIQDVQNDMMPPGTPVELHGVIVTAIDTFGNKTGDIWIEEPGGGPFSGIHVFGAPTGEVTGLALGDIVDVTGAVKDEFALSSDTSGRTVTELKPAMSGSMHVTKSGTGTVPAPEVVDALAIGQKPTQAERDAEWEKWEGVLITVSNVSAFNAPKCITSMGMCTDMTFASFSITGVAKAESSLAAFPANIKSGDCFANMTGVVDYFFDYQILPRSTAEMVTGGTGCAPREAANGSAGNTCIDGTDNDGNGFSDCGDLGCEVGAGAWLGATCTPADAMCGCSANLADAMGANKVDTGTIGAVIFNNVFVTAVGPKGFWIADSQTAAPNSGVFVFTSIAPTATVGQKLATVQGLAGPFNGSKMTGTMSVVEVTSPTNGTVVSSGNAFTPITSATATQLADLTNGAQFAGSLVQLTHLKVKTAGQFGQFVLVDNNNATITMDDGAFATYGGTAPTLGTCFATLTGVMDFNTFDPQVRTVNPRSASDMATGTGCTGN